MSLDNEFVKNKLHNEYSNEKMSDEDKLKKVATKAIQTTMIGALDIIEQELGFLWNHGEFGELTEEEQQMKDKYEKIRTHILDNGNSQIRGLDKALSKEYRTMWLPVKRNK